MCRSCDIITRITGNRIRKGALALINGHNTDEYGTWLGGGKDSVPTPELVEELEKIKKFFGFDFGKVETVKDFNAICKPIGWVVDGFRWNELVSFRPSLLVKKIDGCLRWAYVDDKSGFDGTPVKQLPKGAIYFKIKKWNPELFK